MKNNIDCQQPPNTVYEPVSIPSLKGICECTWNEPIIPIQNNILLAGCRSRGLLLQWQMYDGGLWTAETVTINFMHGLKTHKIVANYFLKRNKYFNSDIVSALVDKQYKYMQLKKRCITTCTCTVQVY